MNITEYLVAWLITFGLSFSIAIVSGPFGVFKVFRKRVKTRYGNEHWMSEGISCPICMSFWVGAIVGFSMNPKDPLQAVSVWLSSFGFVCAVVCLSQE